MVRLFCCIGVDEDITDLNLVYHFLDFYTRHGIEDFYIILQSNREDRDRVTATQKILEEYGIPARGTWLGEYRSALLQDYLLQAAGDLGRDDWLIPADVDEFHNFPVPAVQFLAREVEPGTNCLRSLLVDRLAPGGKLPAISRHLPLDEQFPLCLPVTRELARGNGEKIAAFKKPLVPGNGHHAIVKKKRKARYGNRGIETHHFKWDALLPSRLRRRYRHYRDKKIPWFRESERVLRHLDRHKKILAGHFEPGSRRDTKLYIYSQSNPLEGR